MANHIPTLCNSEDLISDLTKYAKRISTPLTTIQDYLGSSEGEFLHSLVSTTEAKRVQGVNYNDLSEYDLIVFDDNVELAEDISDYDTVSEDLYSEFSYNRGITYKDYDRLIKDYFREVDEEEMSEESTRGIQENEDDSFLDLLDLEEDLEEDFSYKEVQETTLVDENASEDKENDFDEDEEGGNLDTEEVAEEDEEGFDSEDDFNFDETEEGEEDFDFNEEVEEEEDEEEFEFDEEEEEDFNFDEDEEEGNLDIEDDFDSEEDSFDTEDSFDFEEEEDDFNFEDEEESNLDTSESNEEEEVFELEEDDSDSEDTFDFEEEEDKVFESENTEDESVNVGVIDSTIKEEVEEFGSNEETSGVVESIEDDIDFEQEFVDEFDILNLDDKTDSIDDEIKESEIDAEDDDNIYIGLRLKSSGGLVLKSRVSEIKEEKNEEKGVEKIPDSVLKGVESNKTVMGQQEKVDSEPEPTDLRQFLRKHPKCDYDFALKYFTKKQINDELRRGRITRKGNILRL